MKQYLFWLLLSPLILASCNPFKILQSAGSDIPFSIIFIVAGSALSIWASALLFKTYRNRRDDSRFRNFSYKEKIGTGCVVLLIGVFLFANGFNAFNYYRGLNFFKVHLDEFDLRYDYHLAADSQYKKVDFLTLGGKKVMIFKTGYKVESRSMPSNVEKPKSLMDQVKQDGKYFKLRFDFADDLYFKLPMEFQVTTEEDFKKVGIIVVVEYSGDVIGKYTNGQEAVQLWGRIYMYDTIEKLYIEQKNFKGGKPPKITTGAYSSGFPYSKIVEYIVATIKH